VHVSIRPELRWAWHGPSLLVADHYGDCRPDEPLTGLYVREARHLSTLRLEINGEHPWQCDIGELSPAELVAHFEYPEHVQFSGGGSDQAGPEQQRNVRGVLFRTIDLRLRERVCLTGLAIGLEVRNCAPEPVELEIAWRVDADFADFIEAQNGSGPRQQQAEVCHRTFDHALELLYQHPALSLGTRIAWIGDARWSATRDRIAALVPLAARETRVLSLDVAALDPGNVLTPSEVESREAQLARWRATLSTYEIPSNRVVERVLSQAVDDLAAMPLLDGDSDEWLAPQAGIPLYPALFGRDAVTASWQAASLDRGEMLDHTLTALAKLQGVNTDPTRDEEPGRIVQQVRRGPVSRLGLMPFARYYGDFASPLMFVVSLAHLYVWTGDRRSLDRHWDAARRVLDWARERGDRDGDGYLEYLTTAPEGPKNQGWKDSGDGIIDHEGRIIEAPLATCELQGYWFAAQQLMAALSAARGEIGDARAYWSSAMELKDRFNRDWWLDDVGFVALALDGEKRPVRSVASNAGHCLAAGIIDEQHIPRVVGRLFAPDMFSGWGIRTLSADHVAYNPSSYHRGSVWAVENATIALGTRRYGFDERAVELTHAMYDLAELYGGRIPECVGGRARGGERGQGSAERGSGPTRPALRDLPGTYPRANSPQTWNASGMLLLMHVLLGLQPVAPLDTLIVDPVLPLWMPEVILRDLRVGGAVATVRFWRDEKGESHAELVRRRGTLHLVRQPPIESLRHGFRDRFHALLDGLVHR
jgi:glycogen debranching enzyme